MAADRELMDLAPTIIRYDPAVANRRWRATAMSRHLGRILLAWLGSEAIPAFVRTRLLMALGAKIDRTACIWAGCCFRSANVDFGKHVFINVGFFFDGVMRLTIEENVRVAQFVRVITASHEIGPTTQRCSMDVAAMPVRIERGCWIGVGVTIMPGVTISRGCVISAGAVVQQSTDPDGLYAGSPARRIHDLPVDT